MTAVAQLDQSVAGAALYFGICVEGGHDFQTFVTGLVAHQQQQGQDRRASGGQQLSRQGQGVTAQPGVCGVLWGCQLAQRLSDCCSVVVTGGAAFEQIEQHRHGGVGLERREQLDHARQGLRRQRTLQRRDQSVNGSLLVGHQNLQGLIAFGFVIVRELLDGLGDIHACSIETRAAEVQAPSLRRPGGTLEQRRCGPVPTLNSAAELFGKTQAGPMIQRYNNITTTSR